MTELQALRDTYRRDKAALLALLAASQASTRGIHSHLRTLAQIAGNLLTQL